MNYKLRDDYSIILMSLRKNAPYADRIEDNGKILIYEGHDMPKYKSLGIGFDPKLVDQPMQNEKGTMLENGKFYNSAIMHRDFDDPAEIVKVYEKIQPGIWSYNGFFDLIDAWQEDDENRKVFKFKLSLRFRIGRSLSSSFSFEVVFALTGIFHIQTSFSVNPLTIEDKHSIMVLKIVVYTQIVYSLYASYYLKFNTSICKLRNN